MYVNTVLSASANNQTLVALDINSTHNTGSFTGVNNYLIRNQYNGSNKFLIDIIGNMGFGTTVPSRHTATTYPTIFVGNSNAGITGETGTGYKGINLLSNIIRNANLSNLACQDTTQPGWLMGLNYETAATDNFSIFRAAATSGAANLLTLFQIKGTGNVLINSTTDAGFKLDVSGSTRITNGLTVTGSLNAPSITGSLLGTATTASFVQTAQTASYVLNAVSASYAATSSYANNFAVAGTFTFDGTLNDYSSVASSIVGSNNIFTQSTGSYRGAFYKYTLYNGTNARSGEIMAVWNAGSVQYTDVSTLDIGTTTDVTASVAIVTSQAQLNFQTNTSGWTIKVLSTYI
jgi:hypothetical protein